MPNELEKVSRLQAQDILLARQASPLEVPTVNRWRVIPRVAGYGVALLIVWMLLSMMLPTLFSHSSERAVIDAPVSLVTTPADGIVTAQQVKVGSQFHAGDTLMTVQNPNVDRSLLVDLTGKQLDNQQHYDAAKAKLAADQTLLATTNDEITKYQAALQRTHSTNEQVLASRVAMAKAQVDHQETIVNRNQALQWAGAVSQAYTDSSRSQLAVLQSNEQQAQAELQNARSESAAVRHKVFNGASDGSVATLMQRRDSLKAEIAQLDAQLSQYQSAGDQINALIAKEQDRLDRLTNMPIKAFDSGVVEQVLAPPGTRVAAGATLIRATNCDDSRVVAVFPRSFSDALLPGSPLTVHVDGVAGPLKATVAQILPSAPAGEQARYLVPFPPVEKNEIYLIAKLDKPLRLGNGGSPQSTCAMGRWAEVNAGKSWWNHLSTLL
ncbi:multidrug transporter [Pandoraea thiooxydans]|uniref:Multidrug transporter n=1 Tax=Pandoraea thiooxydans TaxID=445709 RepID=A0A0G3EQS2_9BURK|nr:HlyD family efflux transporter periplasmic adaptor subunit [Pandoraea thiooxydans]AKJ67682.1 multidrug transporter [Pandoraea thiooxydans]APR94803.1 multidrug transporter [Pandoraea thiooxydans]